MGFGVHLVEFSTTVCDPRKSKKVSVRTDNDDNVHTRTSLPIIPIRTLDNFPCVSLTSVMHI